MLGKNFNLFLMGFMSCTLNFCLKLHLVSKPYVLIVKPYELLVPFTVCPLYQKTANDAVVCVLVCHSSFNFISKPSLSPII